jgi:tetratricopeptide (TPR) repeat protein
MTHGEGRSTQPFGEEKKAAPFVRACFWGVPCLTATLVYARSLGYSFLFDDRAQILLNPQIQSWKYLLRLLTTHVWSQKAVETLIPLYRPVFSVWLLLIYSLVGSTEWAWHAVSLALYVLTIYLVYRLAEELLKHHLAAAITALIFAVHPIHIEAVCWISACNELLIGPLTAASILLFLRQLRLKAQAFWSYRTFLSLLAWMAALFAKESVLPLVAVFPYAAWQFTRRKSSFEQQTKAVALRSGPYFGAVFLYLAVRLSALGKAGLPAGSHAWRQVAYSAPSLLGFYMQKLVYPTGLSSFYLNPLVSSASVKMWVIVVLIFGTLSLLSWLSRKHLEVGVGTILLLGPLVPVIGAAKIFLDGDAVHDRYLFLPSMGLCLIVGMAVRPLLGKSNVARTSALAVILAVVGGFAWLAATQESYYRDEEAYFGRALEINPTNVLVMDYLGDSYMRALRMPEALALFERAHSIAPANPNTTYCLARGLYKSNRYASAEPLLKDVATEPGLTPLRRFRSRMLLAQDELALQRSDRARSILTGLATEEPLAANVHFMLGSIDEVEGRLNDAQSEYLLEYKISGISLAGERALRLSRRLPSDLTLRLPSRGQYQPQATGEIDPE